MAINKVKGSTSLGQRDLYIMKMLFLMVSLLWNDNEGAHAQGKQTYWVDIPSFPIVVANCNRRNGRGGVVV